MSQDRIAVDTFIPDSVGSKDILFENAPLAGTVEFFDGVLILSPAFIFLMLGDIILPASLSSLSPLITVILAIFGILLLVIKPSYMSLYDWLQSLWDFRQREKNVDKKISDKNGKPFESYEAVPDDDTRKLTLVSRVFPERKAIELENGDIISILEFTGSNLDMASMELKLNTVNSYAKSVSSSLQNDIQFYLPMRPVSLDASKRVYENNLNSMTYSVENEQYMQRYLQDRISWLDGLGDSSFVREQYVVVKVTDQDVYDQDISVGQTGIEKIPGGKVIKDIKEGFTGEARMQSRQEIRRKKLRELRNRVENVGGSLAVGPGNDYSMASADKSISLIKEFWEGEKILEDEMKSMGSEYPFPVLNDNNKTEGEKE
jgi:hypothetical protein